MKRRGGGAGGGGEHLSSDYAAEEGSFVGGQTFSGVVGGDGDDATPLLASSATPTPSKPPPDDTHQANATKRLVSLIAFLDALIRYALLIIGPDSIVSALSTPAADGAGAVTAGEFMERFGLEAAESSGAAESSLGAAGIIGDAGVEGSIAGISGSSSAPGSPYDLSMGYAHLLLFHLLGRHFGAYLTSLGWLRSYLDARTNHGDTCSRALRWYGRVAGWIVGLYLLTIVVGYCSAARAGNNAFCLWLRFSSGVLIGILHMAVAGTSASSTMRDAETNRSSLQSYVLGATVSVVSATTLYQTGSLSVMNGLVVQNKPWYLMGCFMLASCTAEWLVCRYVLKIGPGRGGVSGATNTRTQPSGSGRRVLRSALRKVSGCRRRRGRRGMVSSNSEDSFHQSAATPDADGGGDVEMGVSWEPGHTPRAADGQKPAQHTPSSAMDLSQVYQTPDQHAYDSSPTSDVTVKASGSVPLFPNEPLMQSPPFAMMHGGATPTPMAARARTGSASSALSGRSDVFFDCMSEHSADDGEMFMVDEFVGGNVQSPLATGGYGGGGGGSNTVAIYRNGRVVYPDGRPAHVPPHCDCDILPQGYIANFSPSDPSHSSAKAKWEETKKWRQKQHVWRIHSSPHPHFPAIKKAYPHFVHGFTKAGYIIVYEQPGKMELKHLFRSGCTVDDMVHQYVFLMEYVANVLSEKPEVMDARRRWCSEKGLAELEPWHLVLVMDVSGAGPSLLSGDVLRYLKRGSATSAAHYPAKMKRAFVVNSPFWMSGFFAGVRGILPDSVHAELLGGSSQLHYLTQHIDIDQIPAEYGGTSPYKLGEHPFEAEVFRKGEECCSLDEESRIGALKSQDDKVPGLVTLGSASESAATSASASLDGDGDDGTLVDVPFGSPTSQPVQRTSRRLSAESPRIASTTLNQDDKPKFLGPASTHDAIRRRTLTIASILYGCTLLSQNILECSLALWMLSPSSVGGIAYGQILCVCVTATSSLLLIWRCSTASASGLALVAGTSDTKLAAAFHPMRRFRIGAGCTALFSLLLPTAVLSVPRQESFLVLAVTILLLFTLLLAGSIVRSSARHIHDIALQSLEMQRRVDVAGLAGGAGGCILAGLIFGWSLVNHQAFPMNASASFFISSALSAMLYILSYRVSAGPSGGIMLDDVANKGGRRGVWSITIGDIGTLIWLVRYSRSGAASSARTR